MQRLRPVTHQTISFAMFMIKRFFALIWISLISLNLVAQCIDGQSPGSAFPVCGVDTFRQSTVPSCGGTQVFAPNCTDVTLTDVNPFWYKFTCYASGKIGFVIDPNNPADDYDWQLFDITGRSANDVYTNDASLFVACNWSGETGATGASSEGNSLYVCASTGSGVRPLYSAMPELIAGHDYLLLVSHFTVSSQSGYSLTFNTSLDGSNGLANITDPQVPGLAGARAICDGTRTTVKINKKIKCESLQRNGNDFILTPPVTSIVSAVAVNCNGFDMDSILLTLRDPLPPGNYTLTVNSNGLLDNCNNPVPFGSSLPVVVYPLVATQMDSMARFGCAPDQLTLLFSKPMLCNSVAPDGSDFTVTGPVPVSVASAEGINCNADGVSSSIRVKLAAPIQNAGNYRITLRTGSDGNTILNECSMPTAAGSFINFSAADTVNASFAYTVRLGCKTDVIDFSHDGRNGVNKWWWSFDEGMTSTQKDTSLSYTVFGNKKATLIVSNGLCRDTFSNNTILLDNELKASFESTAVVCPEDGATFKDKSYNRVVAWRWDFGDGLTSTLPSPPVQFYNVAPNSGIRDLRTQLIVTNDIGCSDTATGTIRVVGNCYIAVPKAFTPNSDGLNDYLYPTNAYKAKDLYFAIYNRRGNKLFETRNWQVKWDGTYKSEPQEPGTYVWFLEYTHIETGERYHLKGSTVLLR